MRAPPLVAVVVKIVTVKIISVRMIVGIFVFAVKFDRVETNYNQARTAFVANGCIALFALGVNVNFLTAFWTDRCWH